MKIFWRVDVRMSEENVSENTVEIRKKKREKWKMSNPCATWRAVGADKRALGTEEAPTRTESMPLSWKAYCMGRYCIRHSDRYLKGSFNGHPFDGLLLFNSSKSLAEVIVEPRL
ncbi:hypothetical protein RUM44_013694 [Polyplax serrata]|uniref:Uncharacterized protein n=1 Tax=Polyplax serrata TaxID=468196 RepID=A0ABR1BEW3_POLSC